MNQPKQRMLAYDIVEAFFRLGLRPSCLQLLSSLGMAIPILPSNIIASSFRELFPPFVLIEGMGDTPALLEQVVQ